MTRFPSSPGKIAGTVPWRWLAGLLALLLAGGLAWSQAIAPGPRVAVLLTIDGAIGPATADYVKRGLREAAEDSAGAVVLQMNTPGGLDTSMRDIIRAILASPVPVLAWVGPEGARAASAGTYILYASHVAAMAPGTNLGAATPVQLGGGGGGGWPSSPPDKASAPKDGGPTHEPASAMEAKVINDAVGYIRSLAEMRDRNADWAESAVRQAASLSANAALERKVIDLTAGSVTELLAKADGRRVKVGTGTQELHTRGLTLERRDPDWRSQALGVISNPNLAMILMMIGVYGLLFEFMNPGSTVPGTVGAICLVIGLYALSALPINYAGLAMMVLGVALLVAELFTPSFGVLGIGGVIAFVIGSTLLVDSDAPGFAVSVPLVGGVALAGLAGTLLVARMVVSSRQRRVASGSGSMLGGPARVLDWNGTRGHVLAEGERWAALGPEGLQPGQVVRVRAVRGVTVEVVEDGIGRHADASASSYMT